MAKSKLSRRASCSLVVISGSVIAIDGGIISEGGAFHEVIGAFICGSGFITLMGTVLDAFAKTSPPDRS